MTVDREAYMSLVLTNATLIDCVHPEPVEGASVVVEGAASSRWPAAGALPAAGGAG